MFYIKKSVSTGAFFWLGIVRKIFFLKRGMIVSFFIFFFFISFFEIYEDNGLVEERKKKRIERLSVRGNVFL
jgi:hypothetical protein